VALRELLATTTWEPTKMLAPRSLVTWNSATARMISPGRIVIFWVNTTRLDEAEAVTPTGSPAIRSPPSAEVRSRLEALGAGEELADAALGGGGGEAEHPASQQTNPRTRITDRRGAHRREVTGRLQVGPPGNGRDGVDR
jgi:hypothetical protein